MAPQIRMSLFIVCMLGALALPGTTAKVRACAPFCCGECFDIRHECIAWCNEQYPNEPENSDCTVNYCQAVVFASCQQSCCTTSC
jgi:hypothetical protein